jgi:hypothetical protein
MTFDVYGHMLLDAENDLARMAMGEKALLSGGAK